ncbi:MAG: hypothetical protein RLP44_05125 [Aggregatilineales bacterium]
MLQNIKKTQLFFALMLIALLAMAVGLVSAHEGREVGDYQLVFGWRNEPALVGYPNGPEVIISLHEEGEEVDFSAMDINLQVEVTFGPASRTVDLRQQFGAPNRYIADLIPTRPGDYSFRVFGNIGDTEIDEVFTSADGQFSSVEPAGDIQFPEVDATVAELLARIEALEALIAEMQGN